MIQVRHILRSQMNAQRAQVFVQVRPALCARNRHCIRRSGKNPGERNLCQGGRAMSSSMPSRDSPHGIDKPLVGSHVLIAKPGQVATEIARAENGTRRQRPRQIPAPERTEGYQAYTKFPHRRQD